MYYDKSFRFCWVVLYRILRDGFICMQIIMMMMTMMMMMIKIKILNKRRYEKER